MTVHEFPRDHGSLANLDKDHHPQYFQSGGAGPLEVSGSVDPSISTPNETDLPSTYSNGLSRAIVAAAQGWPLQTGARGLLTTFINVSGTTMNDIRGYQLLASSDFNDGAPMRFAQGDAWGPWQQSGSGLLPTNRFAVTDIGDLYPVGMTIFENTSDSTWPSSHGTVVTFKKLDYRMWQMYGSHLGDHWVRSYHTGSTQWSSWSRLTPGGWQTPSLQNGWIDYGGGWETSGYRLCPGGTVQLRGLIRDGTGKIVFYLPAGYRPPKGIITLGRGANGPRRIDIGVGTNGDQVMVNDTLDSWQSLSGISFSVDA